MMGTRQNFRDETRRDFSFLKSNETRRDEISVKSNETRRDETRVSSRKWPRQFETAKFDETQKNLTRQRDTVSDTPCEYL